MPSGRFHAGCEARALETALGLHLLRRLDILPDVQDRLQRYCTGYLVDNTPTSPERADRLDLLVTRLVVIATLGAPLRGSERQQLTAVMTSFNHPTQGRKRAIIQTLLVELGVVPISELSASPATQARGAEHHWIELLLAAQRLLIACWRDQDAAVVAQEVEFLLRHQGANGSWERHVFATTVILIALVRAGADPNAIASGVQFLLQQLRPEGGLPFISDEDTWVTSLAGCVLLDAGGAASSLERVAAYLKSQQHDDGCWAYAEDVAQIDADDTSVAALFLARQDPRRNRVHVARAIRGLRALQNDDGGFPTFVRGAPSDAEITAKAIRALATADGRHNSAVQRAWQWLDRNQERDGGFRLEWNLCKTFSLLHVIEAAAVCSHVSPVVHRVRTRCVDYLRRHRLRDGGWAIRPGDRSSHPLGTAYGVAALACSGDVCAPEELTRALDVILSAQGEDGGFHSQADSLGPRPFVYDVRLLATIYGLWALCNTRDCVRAMHTRTLARRTA
ncbi:MAG: terpene cyclase/mutase family protein [Myxococcales bacterium]|nr:terpene cyclase/mutase family protein [Myxococcales bacterium]